MIFMTPKGQITIDKWTFRFAFVPSWSRVGYTRFIFGLFKINRWPKEGDLLTNSDYSGFLIDTTFKIEFEIAI